MKQTRWLALILIGAFAQKDLHAVETVNSAAGLAFPSVQEAGTARAVGMGSTYVGIAEGSATLLWNPAGLARLCATEVSLHHNSTVLGSFQETGILAMPLNADNGLGVSLNYGDNGSFDGRDNLGNPTSSYTARAYGASLGWGFRTPGDLAFGLALKFNRQDLASSSFNAIAGDLGALWMPTPSFTIGAAYNNIGPDVAGKKLGQGVNLGISTYLWKESDLQWLLSLSGEGLTSSDDSVHAGIEATLFQMLSLRGGYSANLTTPQAANGMLGWTLGAGIKLADLSLDYAYVPMGDIGTVHRVSLTYAFGDCKPTPSPTPSATPSPTPSPTASATPAPTPVAVAPRELVLQLTDADFKYTKVGENEKITKAGQERLHKALLEISGIKGATLRVSGNTAVKGEKADVKAIGKKKADAFEFKEVGIRREKLVRAYVAKNMPAAKVTSVTSPNSENTESDNMRAVFHLEVR